ncbi:calcium-binding protein [Xanthomonas bonasiae]|nr:putative Ig domain-containing protein [Xanthomonas bonasiae]
MNVTMPTINQIVSRYLFNADVPPSNLADEALIRDAGQKGGQVDVDANEYMTTGAGRFAGVERFNFVRNFLAGNDYKGSLAPGVYTTSELLAAYGITDNLLAVQQYYQGVYESDYSERAYVFGSGNYKINDDAVFYVNENGTREIDNICVVPVDNDFDYESTNWLATVTNGLTEGEIDPSGIGRTVPIHFTGTVTQRYSFSAEDWYALDLRNTQAMAAELVAKTALVADIDHFAALFASLLGGLVANDIITYEDADNRFVVYDGKDTNNSNAKLDAMALLNLTEQFPYDGVVVIAGNGNDHLYGTGYTAGDELRGGAGNDTLEGRGGDDILNGGTGSDMLYGGQGQDTYVFTSGNSGGVNTDTIFDSSGDGSITFDGAVVSVGERLSEVSWRDTTNKLKITFLDGGNGRGMLVLDVIGSQDSIRIRDWTQGDLGLTLAGQVPPISGSQMTGDDDLFGSGGNNSGDDSVSALAGNDGLEGGAGDDHLDGGAGNDLILGGTGDDVLIGGDGNDYIYDGYEQADFRELDKTPDPDTGKSEQDEFYERVNELGAAVLDHGKAWYIADLIHAPGWTELDPNATPSGDDMIDAGSGNDIVVAGDGNDIIRGGSGNDRLTGGYDNDVIFGEADDDTISGDYPDAAGAGNAIGWRSSAQANHNGNDAIDGGAGNDSISGNGGNDVLSGGDDNDRIWGRGMAGAADSDDADSDYIDGGAGDDILTGDDGDDVIIGGIGNDNIWGDNSQAGTRHGNDSIDAGAGNDFVSGGGGDDMIDGGAGSDTLIGDARDIDGSAHGRDLIHGGADNDIIDGGGGDDALYGDDGDDQIVGDVASDGTLAAVYHGNDYLDGGAGNDLLIGNGGNDQLSGGTGDDELQGGDGDDLLDGGAGKDVLLGEAGDDTLSGGSDDDKLYGGAGDDRLSGGAGADTLAGGDGKDVLDGGEGNDILDGEAGNDTIYGGAGDDTIDADDGDDTVYAGVGNDSIYAGAGNDVIHAEDGNDIVTAAEGDDQVYGGAGSDTLHGSAGNDTLYGEDGDDYLIGGAGNDTLIGGAGLNRYYFDRQFGHDVVELAIDSQDQIYLQQGIAAEEVTFTRDQNDLVLAMADGSSLRVAGYFATGTAAWIQLGDGSWISRELIDSGVYYGSVTGGSGAGENLQGTDGDDRLYGLGGDDTIDGQGGNDLIDGGQGNDTLSDGQGNDVVYGGAGNDVINLVHNGGGNGSDVIDGGAGDDTYNIAWGSGYDVIGKLDAANAGSDTINLVGISQNMVMNYQVDGNDLMIFISGSAGSPGATADNMVVLEGFLANGGHRVRFAEGTELSTADFQQRSWTGTSGNDTYVGTFAPDVINGLGGNDTLSGMDGNDSIYGGEGDDVLDGGSGNDVLYGDEGNDIVRGGDGDDRLYMGYRGNYVDRYIGGNGNDAYYLNHNYTSSASPPTTQSSNIEEEAGGGIDTLYTNFYYSTLGANIENLVYTPANFWYTNLPSELNGNALDNVIQIIKTSSASHMPDLSFRLDGKGGKDTLMGSSGKDTYVVDSADDVIVEQQTDYDSIDTVEASLDYSIETRLELENIRLIGTAVSATGNSDANVLEGHLVSGINQLSGLGGNDIYLVTRKDIVIESINGGNDTVVIAGWDELTDVGMWVSVSDYGNVENLTLYNVGTSGPYGSIRLRGNIQGDTGDNVLMGNMYANEIHGGAGNDVLNGYYKNTGDSEQSSIDGADLLYGEDGNDTIYASVYGADIYGGKGDDILIGTGGAAYSGTRSGSDRFFYDIGDGTDHIRSINSDRDTDRVIFGVGIDPDDVTWSKEGTSLIVQVGNGTSDRLIVENYWREDAPGQFTLMRAIEEFEFADGTIRRGDLDQLSVTNNAPIATSFALPSTVRIGESFEIMLPEGAFVDDPGDTLTYSLSGPEWMSINSQTGTISGTPPQSAEYVSFTITAADRFGQTASRYLGFSAVLVLTGTQGDDLIVGSNRSEELHGLGGNDRLEGNGGSDVLYGGAGDDTYVLSEDAFVTVVELAGEGFDTVESGQYDYVAAVGIERVVLIEGSEAQAATSGDGSQELIGNSADNYLDGGAGADKMAGGLGDDYYVIDDAGDVIIEAADGGADEAMSYVTWTLSDNVEIGHLGDGPDLGLTGNALSNQLHGNAWDNALDGGSGADTLYGYAGNDIYYLDTDSDQIIEQEGEGIDTVVRGFGSQYVLADNVENLRLTGNAAQGNGNALDNLVEGNSIANSLLGLDGNDQLRGMAGNDTLWGGNGEDLLVGGEGDDMYVIDATTGSDRVDNTGGGTDTLLTNGVAIGRLGFARDGDDLLVTIDGAATPAARIAGHFLGGDAELDYVQASDNRYSAAQIAAIINGGSNPGAGFDQTLTGTTADEQLVGSAGKDLIEGLSGADTLFGMEGSDTLRGGDGNDYLSGGSGNGSGSGNDVLEGGVGDDTLRGEDGNNTLAGGAGDDQYIYGGGIDVIDNTGGGTDWLIFENGITTSQLALVRDGDDLVITVNGNANQRVTVTDHFLGGDMALDYLQPASDSALNTAAINALVTNNGGGGDNGGGTPGTGNDADYPSQKTGTAADEQIVGTSGRDLIKGLGGADTLFGMGADDKLDGGDGDDYLSGGNGSFTGSGNDILIGGAGDDQLVGEDGADMLFGGAGNDTYFYAAGSGVDTIDNTGGGTDWLYFDGIDRGRLTYHREGDDLIVRVDGDAGQQMRVLDHFLGGERAVAYVQPGDGGYAISAATIAGQLTPLGSAGRSVSAASLTAEPTLDAFSVSEDEASNLTQAIEAFAIAAPILRALTTIEAGTAPSANPQHGIVLPPPASGDVTGLGSGKSEPPISPSFPTGAMRQPHAEIGQLVESLASFAGQSALPAANDIGYDESGIANRMWTWRMSHTSHGLRLRQMEL